MSDGSHPILVKREVLSALATLSSELRHDIFRLLARREPHGMEIADICRELGIGSDMARAALTSLAHATLARRVAGGAEAYRADLDKYGSMMAFLRQPIDFPAMPHAKLKPDAPCQSGDMERDD